ncbi:MAG: hypothetical protein AB7O32_20500 [Vicinamibacterales bacterium]
MPGPFDALESAHEYVTLLVDQVREVKSSIETDVAEAEATGPGRRLDALRVVDFKLGRLERDLVASRRNLNDLRALRRVLLGERAERVDRSPVEPTVEPPSRDASPASPGVY